MDRKKIVAWLSFTGFFLLALFFIIRIFFPDNVLFSQKRTLDFSALSKNICLLDEGSVFPVSTEASTVEDFLQEKNIPLEDSDEIFPARDTPLYSGLNIIIHRSIPFTIKVDGQTIKSRSTAKTVLGALEENKITLGRLDISSEPLYARFGNNDTITITRIDVEEKIINEDIAYKTTTKEDKKLGWREERVEQKGETGIREVKYKITYKNDKEVSRVVLEKNVIKDPVDAIKVKGTYMKLGKANGGQGTWYSFQGGLYAASTSIPRGGFAKVTNTANGKSVIVEINDYGPQGKGRIIDLDKVAFAKIAPIGAGVIGVKVEQILN
jgi:uncharacterized protein YabE (DUF348 family)